MQFFRKALLIHELPEQGRWLSLRKIQAQKSFFTRGERNLASKRWFKAWTLDSAKKVRSIKNCLIWWFIIRKRIFKTRRKLLNKRLTKQIELLAESLRSHLCQNKNVTWRISKFDKYREEFWFESTVREYDIIVRNNCLWQLDFLATVSCLIYSYKFTKEVSVFLCDE